MIAKSEWKYKRLGAGVPDELRGLSAADLLNMEIKREWLVRGVVVKDEPLVIGAAKKGMKTTLACDMALSLASGGKFLGGYPCPQACKVAFLSAESGKFSIKSMLRRIGESKGLDANSEALQENLKVELWVPRLGDMEAMLEFREWVGKNEFDVVFVDPMYLAMGGLGRDAGNLFVVGEYLMALTQLMVETGSTVVCIHHLRQGAAVAREDQDGPPELEDLSWSGFPEWARQWILMNRRVEFDPDCPGTHKLWLGFGGSAGHSGKLALDIDEGWDSSRGEPCGYQLTIQSARDIKIAKAEEKEQQQKYLERLERQCVMTTIARFPDGETKSALCEASQYGEKKFKRIFKQLQREGHVVKCVVTKEGNGKEYDGWKLSDAAKRWIDEQDGRADRSTTDTITPPKGGGGDGGDGGAEAPDCPPEDLYDYALCVDETPSDEVPF